MQEHCRAILLPPRMSGDTKGWSRRLSFIQFEAHSPIGAPFTCFTLRKAHKKSVQWGSSAVVQWGTRVAGEPPRSESGTVIGRRTTHCVQQYSLCAASSAHYCIQCAVFLFSNWRAPLRASCFLLCVPHASSAATRPTTLIWPLICNRRSLLPIGAPDFPPLKVCRATHNCKVAARAAKLKRKPRKRLSKLAQHCVWATSLSLSLMPGRQMGKPAIIMLNLAALAQEEKAQKAQEALF